MKKFKVYDLYDGKETLGYVDSMAEIRALARQRVNDTDGECAIFYAELNPETNKYKFSSCVFLKSYKSY